MASNIRYLRTINATNTTNTINATNTTDTTNITNTYNLEYIRGENTNKLSINVGNDYWEINNPSCNFMFLFDEIKPTYHIIRSSDNLLTIYTTDLDIRLKKSETQIQSQSKETINLLKEKNIELTCNATQINLRNSHVSYKIKRIQINSIPRCALITLMRASGYAVITWNNSAIEPIQLKGGSISIVYNGNIIAFDSNDVIEAVEC